ncbi:glycosyltransferase [Clostridium culturomicium]|uniref:glycosyltransferase n=1 Tax=Clostridium culturomicium TaxID=1499683 RepID=UPI0038993EFF
MITGKNKNLFHSLKSKYPSFNTILYTDKVYEYMQSSDILISKASGITVFEALYAEIPLYIINLFLLQEISNARYIAKR